MNELWPNLAQIDAESEQETDPGEYHLDSLAVLPGYRHHGIGRALLLDGIQLGASLGYKQLALVADSARIHIKSLIRPSDLTKISGWDMMTA